MGIYTVLFFNLNTGLQHSKNLVNIKTFDTVITSQKATTNYLVRLHLQLILVLLI